MAYFEVSFSTRYSICVEAEDEEEAQMMAEQDMNSIDVDLEWKDLEWNCDGVDRIPAYPYDLFG